MAFFFVVDFININEIFEFNNLKMKSFVKYLSLIYLVIFSCDTHAQSLQELAREKGKLAVELTDKGEYLKSIELLEQAQELDPENYIYPYEIAYTYYVQKNYKKAIKVISKLITYRGINEDVFVLWGNSYDNLNKQKKAMEIYVQGLVKFPYSGKLYTEIGIAQLRSKKIQAALESFEKGIELNPTAPSNYYWASRVFAGSVNSGWSLIYGEIFMNLEAGSKRTTEMSEMMNEIVAKRIKILNDSMVDVDLFDKEEALNEMMKNYSSDTSKRSLSFPLIYEIMVMDAFRKETTINEKSFMRMRTKMVNMYFKNQYDKKYPNALINYQKKIIDAGFWEEYNTFIILQSNKEKFELWLEQNKTRWDEFVDWFNVNRLNLNLGNRFYRNQYLRLQDK